MNRPGQLMNAAEIAALFGVSVPAVVAWIADGCPVVQRGDRGKAYQFNSADVIRWFAARNTKPGPDYGDAADLRLRKQFAETVSAEIDQQRKIGAVVPVEDVAELFGAALETVRASFLSLPTKLAPLVSVETDMKKCQQLLERHIQEAMAEISEWAASGPSLPNGSGS
jgi:terminase small subunit / prophage DNA-packing protein